MADSFEIKEFFPGIPATEIFNAWLESEAHSAFTGSPARVNPGVGGEFSAWDGYISGKTLEIEPYLLEISFEEIGDGTQLTLVHTNIPDGQGEDYRQGWEDYYFKPMQQFFSAQET